MDIDHNINIYNHINKMISKFIRYQFDFNNGCIDIDDVRLIITKEFKELLDVIDEKE